MDQYVFPEQARFSDVSRKDRCRLLLADPALRDRLRRFLESTTERAIRDEELVSFYREMVDGGDLLTEDPLPPLGSMVVLVGVRSMVAPTTTPFGHVWLPFIACEFMTSMPLFNRASTRKLSKNNSSARYFKSESG